MIAAQSSERGGTGYQPVAAGNLPAAGACAPAPRSLGVVGPALRSLGEAGSRRRLLHAARTGMGSASAHGCGSTRPRVEPLPAFVTRVSRITRGARVLPFFHFAKQSAFICVNLRLREWPSNPVIFVQNSCLTITPLTIYGLGLCVIFADGSVLKDSRKVCRVSRCPATLLKVNKAKSHKKNSEFFFGHFYRKSSLSSG